MKITEDVRKYAAEQGIKDSEAIESGMQEKGKEFQDKGSEIYAKGLTFRRRGEHRLSEPPKLAPGSAHCVSSALVATSRRDELFFKV